MLEIQQRTKAWEVNNPWAHHIHHRIGEMISIDCQPFSIMEDDRFAQLLNTVEPRYTFSSTRYMTKTVLTWINEGVAAQVRIKMAGVEWFSFTTDIWSMEVTNNTLLSLTTHWLSLLKRNQQCCMHKHSQVHTLERSSEKSTKKCSQDRATSPHCAWQCLQHGQGHAICWIPWSRLFCTHPSAYHPWRSAVTVSCNRHFGWLSSNCWALQALSSGMHLSARDSVQSESPSASFVTRWTNQI